MTENIKQYLDHASKAYYSGHPVISDEVFDALAVRYSYNKVGAATEGKKARHAYPMFSLQKHYEDEGVHPLADVKDKSASPKLDGAAVEHLYIDGAYVSSTTRGDGVWGVDVTEKFLATNLIPKTIGLMGVVQVTGELVAPKHIENARNYAAGSLNLKSVDEFKTRAVNFYAYGVQPYQYDTYNQDMRRLEQEGFKTVKEPDLHNIYPCDGIVYRVNSNALFQQMGYTAKHPNGAYALKERQEAVETKILDVEWQVGKTGKVTPVAILEPVMIGDAQVSRATLNNPGFIEMLGIEIGDTVAIVRSGEIIPKILYKVDA